jgi:LAO/AO transport system kinase
MRHRDPHELCAAALGGDRAALGRLLTLVDEQGDDAEVIDRIVTERAATRSDRAAIIGVTGPPGAGKSTLVDRLVNASRAVGRTVGVLAVDPTSPFSGGAMLGDRVRMGSHLGDDGVLIRSLATRGALGGLTGSVSSMLRVLSATGFDELVVETVGVGQVELDVATLTDTVVVVVNPGWGDEVQAAKAGLMEIADVFVVNKSDRGDAARTAHDLRAMSDLSARPVGAWAPAVVTTSALHGDGIDDLVAALVAHKTYLGESTVGRQRERKRAEHEVHARVASALAQRAASICGGPNWDALVSGVVNGSSTAADAARALLPELTERLSNPDFPMKAADQPVE